MQKHLSQMNHLLNLIKIKLESQYLNLLKSNNNNNNNKILNVIIIKTFVIEIE